MSVFLDVLENLETFRAVFHSRRMENTDVAVFCSFTNLKVGFKNLSLCVIIKVSLNFPLKCQIRS